MSVIPVLKKRKKIQITKQIIDQPVYYLQFQKYLRDFFLSRFNDLIFFIQKTDVCYTTIYSCLLNYKEAAHKLSINTDIVLNWFKINSTVANPGKL